MAFPESRLLIKNELLIDGSWVDVTSLTRNSDNVTITRGYRGEQSNLSSAQCNFTLNNRDGRFSNRNPLSPYYGLIGRNTPFRNSITGSGTFLRLLDSSNAEGEYGGDNVQTTDKAVLDITGDIDIRIDIEPDNWRGVSRQFLASKYVTTSDQRSWTCYITVTGLVTMIWSTDGTSGNRVFATSTERVATTGRQAIRITVDVNNGASGNTTTFYTSDTIEGSWTQLGDTVVNSGTSSIHSGTAPLEIGTINNAGDRYGTIAAAAPFTGKIYGFELRNGIGGTLVADMDPTAQAAGSTSWSDGLGTPNTWTVNGAAEITAQDYRFYGEVSKLPQRWDTSGTDVYVPTTASDIIQRLTQGAKPLQSAIYRNLSRFGADGYWPMEDGSNATQISSDSGKSVVPPVDFSFGSDDGLKGSTGVLTFTSDSSYAEGEVLGTITSSTGTAYVLFYFKMPSVPGSTTGPIMNFYYIGGTVYRLTISVSATAFDFSIINAEGTSLLSSSVSFGTDISPDDWIAMRFRMVQSGANINYSMGWFDITTGAGPVGASSTINSQTCGRPRSWISFPYTGKNGLKIAHVVLSRTDIDISDATFVGSSVAWVGESAYDRFKRLCVEAGIPWWIVGQATDTLAVDLTEAMGVQATSTLMTLLQECADADGGLITSPRDKFGIAFHLRSSMLNRYAMQLDYSANHLSGKLEPDEDDSLIQNDVTVTRPNGGSARSVQTEGSLNVNDPQDDPQGVGTYNVSLSRNVESDTQLPYLAQHEKFLGTWDELRYKNVEVELARSVFVNDASLTAEVYNLDLCDPFIIANLPSWLPPDDVELLAIGYTETQKNREHNFKWTTRPYGPFRVNNLTETDDSRYRAAASDSSLSTSIDSSTTSLLVKTPTGPLWGTTAGKPGNFPLDIMVGGERITVSAIGSSIVDAFGRTSASSFGSADTGGAYTLTGGSASNYNVSSGMGRITVASTDTNRYATLGGLSASDCDIYVTTAVSAVATGASLLNAIAARWTDVNNTYRAEVTFTTSGTVDARIRSVVGGSSSSLVLVSGVASYSAGTLVRCRFQVIGTTLRMKVWLAASAEPTGWSCVATDSNLSSGNIGVWAWANGGNSNSNPEARFDDLNTINPQLFTASARSVNSVTKSHTVGDEVQIVDKFYATL